MLARLAHAIAHHRRLVIGIWLVLTLFGGFSASQVSKRWFQSFSIPGYSAYETNQKALEVFGTGEQAPQVAVFHSAGDVTKEQGIATGVYYPVPLHRQPCFQRFHPAACPVSDRLAGEVLALPCFPGLRPDEQDRVIAAVRRFYGR